MGEQATLERQRHDELVHFAKYGDLTPDVQRHLQKYYIYGYLIDQNWMCQWGIDNGVLWALTDDDRRAVRLGMEVKPLIAHRLSECVRMASERFLRKYEHQIPGIRMELAWVKRKSAACGVGAAYCWSFPKLGDASIIFATMGLDAKRAEALEKFKEELAISGKLRLWLKVAVASIDDVFKLPEGPCEDDSKKFLDASRFHHLFEDVRSIEML